MRTPQSLPERIPSLLAFGSGKTEDVPEFPYKKQMKIGLDFDNTLVCYDEVFHRTALETGLISADIPQIKNLVRDYLRENGKEAEWTALQGVVYGSKMEYARPFEGALEFISEASKRGHELFIVSHKTRFPANGSQHDLHLAAREWLSLVKMEKLGVCSSKVFFETTREDKIHRIRAIGCEVFIDDLPEVLEALLLFPEIKSILFDPNAIQSRETRFERLGCWADALKAVLDL